MGRGTHTWTAGSGRHSDDGVLLWSPSTTVAGAWRRAWTGEGHTGGEGAEAAGEVCWEQHCGRPREQAWLSRLSARGARRGAAVRRAGVLVPRPSCRVLCCETGKSWGGGKCTLPSAGACPLLCSLFCLPRHPSLSVSLEHHRPWLYLRNSSPEPISPATPFFYLCGVLSTLS